MEIYVHCMMRWFLSFVVTLAPLAAKAQYSGLRPNVPGMTQEQYDLLARSRRTFQSYGYDVVVSESEGKALVIRPNVTEDNPRFRTGIEFPYTDEREIRRFSPRRFAAQLTEAARAARPGETLKHTIQRFPRESFLFFLAIGGVTAVQLATEYSANPVRMDQHIHHSLSPMGMAGFFTFIYANGVTTNVLSTMIKNQRFHSFIPYLGMTAGFFVQSTIATFAADPNVKACVAGMIGMRSTAATQARLGGTDPETACDVAFEYYAVKRKLIDLAPGLISMLGSTFLAGMVQRGLVNGLYRWAGINIGFLFVPGAGWTMAGLRFAFVSLVQMGLFVYFDQAWLMRPVNFAFKNLVDGPEISGFQRKIVEHTQRMKQRGWEDDLPPSVCEALRDVPDSECPRENLNAVLKRFQQRSADWRMTNLSEVYEGHQAWQDKLNNFAGTFEIAYDFLSQFVDEVRNSLYRFSGPFRLEEPAPLYGVTAKGLEEGYESLYFLRPNYTSAMAQDTVTDVAAMLQVALNTPVAQVNVREGVSDVNLRRLLEEVRTNLASPDRSTVRTTLRELDENLRTTPLTPEVKAVLIRLYLTALTQPLVRHEKHVLEQIRVKLASGQIDTITQGIVDLRREYRNPQRTSNLRTAIYNVMLALGNPNPLIQPGRGFLKAYVDYGPKAQQVAAIQHPNTTGFFQTPLITEHLLVQAACGPDLRAGESVVGERWGFPVKFQSPLMIQNKNEIANRACGRAYGAPDAFYDFHLNIRGERMTGMLPYLRQNLQPEILGTREASGFNTWWQQNVESQMEAAYEKYAEEYNNLMVSMVRGIHRENDSVLNFGPLANGPITSIRQTLGLHMVLLGEMTKDIHLAQRNAPLPASYFAEAQEPAPFHDPVWRRGNLVPLLAVLRQQGTYEWNRIVGVFPNTEPYRHLQTSGGTVIGRSLKIQKEIEEEFNRLIALIGRIEIVQRDCRPGRIRRDRPICTESISSPLQNSDLNEQADKIGAKLGEWADLLGVGENRSQGADGQPIQAIVSLTGGQEEVAKTLLEGMQGLVSELHFFGTMPNAVSWEKIRDLNNVSDQQRRHNEAMRAKIEQLRRALGHRVAG